MLELEKVKGDVGLVDIETMRKVVNEEVIKSIDDAKIWDGFRFGGPYGPKVRTFLIIYFSSTNFLFSIPSLVFICKIYIAFGYGVISTVLL